MSYTARIYCRRKKTPKLLFCASHPRDTPPAIPFLSRRAPRGLGSRLRVLLISPDILIALLLRSRPSGDQGTAAAGRVQNEGETTNLYSLHYFLLALFRYYFRVLKDLFLYLFTRI